MFKGRTFIVLNILCILCFCASNGNADENGFRPNESPIMPERLTLGETTASCRKLVRLQEVSPQMLDEYGFSQLLPNIMCESKIVWVDEGKTNQWPTYYVGYFSSTGKLIDVLKINGGNLRPLVRGVFQQRLETIKTGMTVDQMYDLLGRRNPVYYKSGQGRWIVKFEFMDVDTHFIQVEADAGSGVIVKTWDGTI